MKIKKMGRFLSLFPIVGISLAPFGIYIKEEYINHEWIKTHETIHWKQQMEMLIIFFYVWYLLEWLIKYIMHGKSSYFYLSFEREAYIHNKDKDYLNKRKHYAWFKFLKFTNESINRM
jgi:hypothetical protein